MDDPAIVAGFLAQYRTDKAGGTARSMESYQADYPGFEDVIAREFMDLEEREKLRNDAGPAHSKAVDAGRWVGPFRILEELGRGGQGEVYLAEDARLHRRVALKTLHRVGALSEDALRRFRREAEVTSRLDHPGICA